MSGRGGSRWRTRLRGVWPKSAICTPGGNSGLRRDERRQAYALARRGPRTDRHSELIVPPDCVEKDSEGPRRFLGGELRARGPSRSEPDVSSLRLSYVRVTGSMGSAQAGCRSQTDSALRAMSGPRERLPDAVERQCWSR